MSKYVKDLMTQHLSSQLEGVSDMLLVDCSGMEMNSNVALRKHFRGQGIKMLVVKNSLGRRATEGTALAGAFEGVAGSCAVVWGGEDIVTLAKEVDKAAGDEAYATFAAKGGMMDGQPLTAEDVKKVSKWPSRLEQLSILSGQILSPGAELAAQLNGPGGLLAGQIKSKSEE